MANSILTEELSRAESERATALAQVAVAGAVIAEWQQSRVKWDMLGNQKQHERLTAAEAALEAYAIPADATAALTAMLDRARGEAIEAAKAAIAESLRVDHAGPSVITSACAIIDAMHTPATRAAKGCA